MAAQPAPAPNNNTTGIFTPSNTPEFASGPAQTVTLPASTVSEGSTPAATTSTVSEEPSTVTQGAASSDNEPASAESPTVVVVTSAVTSVAPDGSTTRTGPQTVLITSTSTGQRSTGDAATRTVTTSSPSPSASKSGAAALATDGVNSGTSGGLSAGSKIAVAVVVPVIGVALLAVLLLWLWRRRKQKKEAEDLRRKEVEEYGFNPNHDPTLPVVGGASSNADDSEMTQNDGSGYRGWGTTSTARKASTTLSSGNGPIGVARSTSGSDNGRHTNGSPTGGTNPSSDVQSNDPLMGSPPLGRPLSGDSETIGALGAVPSNDNRQNNMHRGPSNASSAYSAAHRSDTSAEGGIPGGAPGPQYYNEGLYYDEGMPQHGPYGDGSYGGGQPIIRDVPARRNTRIENPSVIPPQGSAGIAQNF